MSTLASAALSSDDEGDADFQLPEPKSKGKSRKRPRSNSASGSSSSDSDDELDTIDTTEAQKLKAEQEAAESEERRKRAAAAFEAMKMGSTAAVNKPSLSIAGSGMVEVKRARNFAGETITYVWSHLMDVADHLSETVMLPADHPDAIAYLKKGSASESADKAPVEETAKPQTTETATIADAGPSKPKTKPPPRRKPRQSLEAMSAALDKGKKMTTLEKVGP
jgi:hypothetical protein